MQRLRHPIRSIREPFGKAGLTVAVVALVFAMLGGAYAASNSSQGGKATASAKAKKGPRGPKGPKGDTGAQGSPGTNGKDGTNGTNGKDGTNGTNGKDGTDGTDGEDGMCTAGNPACELPSNSELVGAWSTSGGAGKEEHRDISLTPISFNVRVSPAPTALWAYEPGGDVTLALILKDGSIDFYPPGGTDEELFEAWENKCPGTADQPAAEPGFLCIYNKEVKGAAGPSFSTQELAEAANEYGIVVPWKVGDGEYAKGSWAVTAE